MGRTLQRRKAEIWKNLALVLGGVRQKASTTVKSARLDLLVSVQVARNILPNC